MQAQKIEYVCIKKPTVTKLDGFELNQIYKGRTYNNLYEISVEWASHKPTFLIEKKMFDQFFKLVERKESNIENKIDQDSQVENS